MRAPSLLLALPMLALAFRAVEWLASFFPFAGDYRIYERALGVLAAGGNPYEPFDIGSGFLYHPAALFFVAPLARFGPWPWIVVVAVAFALALRLALVAARQWAATGAPPFDRRMFVPPTAAAPAPMPTASPLAAAARSLSPLLLLAFGPLWDSIYAGQIDTLVLLALVLCVVCARRGAEVPAGIALGIAIVLKMSPALLLLWLATQRQWRALATAIGLVAALTGIAALVWGGTCLVEYAHAVRLSADVTFHYTNLGCKELLARLLGDGAGGIAHKVVFAAAILYSLGRRAQFERLVVAMTMFSPLVWYHHLVYLVLPILVAMRRHPVLTWGAIGAFQAEREIAMRLPALTGVATVAAAALLFFTLPRERGISWPAREELPRDREAGRPRDRRPGEQVA